MLCLCHFLYQQIHHFSIPNTLRHPSPVSQIIKLTNNQMTNHEHGRTALATLLPFLLPLNTKPLLKRHTPGKVAAAGKRSRRPVAGCSCSSRNTARRIKNTVINYALELFYIGYLPVTVTRKTAYSSRSRTVSIAICCAVYCLISI